MTGVALIPARGGSRRIPRKNLRPFLGVPAIERVITTIADSGIVERTVVSTDDAEIANVARSAGAEVPGTRPPSLADDHTPTIDVVRHAIEAWFSGVDPDAPLWVVYPTALLLSPEILREAAARFRAADADFLLSILRYPHPIERRLLINASGLVRPVDPSRMAMRTQDLTPWFHDAGQFYVGPLGAWRISSPLESSRTVGSELPVHAVVDIDEPDDWARAELLAQVRAASDPFDDPSRG
jgi:N-acylneuraminate cytidylyltransferase